MRIVTCVLVAVAALGSIAAIAAEKSPVREAEAGKPSQPRVLLADKLGIYLTIEGVRREKNGSKLDGDRGFLIVDTVNGEKLARPVGISLKYMHKHVELPPKKRCIVKGYETGKMTGTPPAVFEAAKEQGREEEIRSQLPQQPDWGWSSEFVVLIVKAPAELQLDMEPKAPRTPTGAASPTAPGRTRL